MAEASSSPPPSSSPAPAPSSAVAAGARWRARAVVGSIVVGLLLGGAAVGAWTLRHRPRAFAWTPAPSRAFSPDQQRVRLLFAGDVSVARGVGASIERAGGDPRWLLAHMRPVFDDADLVFANLECVLSNDEGLPAANKKFRIRGSPADARALSAGGVDVVSVANNHAMDLLYEGFFQTLTATTELGLLVTGVKEEDGQRLLVVPVGRMKVGFLAYNAHGDEWAHLDWRPRAAPYDIDEILGDVARARRQVDQLVVSLHWGPELSHEPWPWQRQDARRMVDAGVDLVIGHHPHVEQPVEQYNDGLIAYSLGDLAFDKKAPWLRARTGPRFVLAVDYDGARRTGFQLIPIHHGDDYRPYPAPAQDTASLVVASAPSKSTWRASDHVEQATVSRGGVACAPFVDGRPRLEGGWLRWLAKRWRCPNDETLPGDAVGRSTELSSSVMRTGVWASPGGGDVVVAFAAVPIGATMTVVAGFPDWAVASAVERGAASPTTLEVRADGAVVHTATLPPLAGWREATIDTRALSGRTVGVEVVVRGPRYPQPGFLFELEVR